MKYKSMQVTRLGGIENLHWVENELRTPAPGEARVRILATPVCQDDVAMRVGNRPFLVKPPYVPGYAFIGEVDAVGENVNGVTVGERVTALTKLGSHAEYIYIDAQLLAPVPESLDPVEVAPLILNYLVAYQVLHRVARVKPGDKALIIGASGGVGSALMQLGELAGIKMYGLASPAKHPFLAQYGVIPIDYRTQDFVDVLRQAEPGGVGVVFNGMGEEYYERGLAVLRRSGMLVHYGGPQTFSSFLLLVAKLLFYNLLPNGKKIEGYGTHRLGVDLFKEDWQALFRLLEEGKIRPVIQKTLPLFEAVEAYQLLESGAVTGNLVLVAPGCTAEQAHG